MSRTPTIVEFATDSQLLNLSLSLAQDTLLRGIYGLPLRTTEQRDLWHACTGGRTYRADHHYPEVTVIAGARAGKDSRILAPVLCYEAAWYGPGSLLTQVRGHRLHQEDALDGNECRRRAVVFCAGFRERTLVNDGALRAVRRDPTDGV